jgi:hypothetical protein
MFFIRCPNLQNRLSAIAPKAEPFKLLTGTLGCKGYKNRLPIYVSGEWALDLELVNNERPQYSCNFVKPVKVRSPEQRKLYKKICAGD